ncbi:hypothetical protein EYF80_007240 [Liparis tanakae]|uniref:Uncharacterized protein n=1 Tax=Liparis tanakae TaxID=230148 RepID=A0A4Z2IWS0_9TELE|nr:hypothetical protein EYF80_007240 [Liparis tanakae]
MSSLTFFQVQGLKSGGCGLTTGYGGAACASFLGVTREVRGQEHRRRCGRPGHFLLPVGVGLQL